MIVGRFHSLVIKPLSKINLLESLERLVNYYTSEVIMSVIVLASTENMDYVNWLDWRRKGIGGSDASIICGINRNKLTVELWMDKTGQLFPLRGATAFTVLG